MYHHYFQLTQPPFRITPDTRLFFPGGDRGAILEALLYAITQGEGIVKVVGEVGSGKTMLCRMLESELPQHVETVYLANPSLSRKEILHAIAMELGIPASATEERLTVMHRLYEFLVKKHAENRQVVMLVEEAQSMPIETLEEIRLLSNLETQHEKLLQIVLFGQPELDHVLSEPAIRPLKDRIINRFYLAPFKQYQIREYVNSRLWASGYRGTEVFAPGAIRAIERYSQGLLRRINILADKAMLAAYVHNELVVTARHVKMAAQDGELTYPWQWSKLVAVIGVSALIVMGVSWWLYNHGLPAGLVWQ